MPDLNNSSNKNHNHNHIDCPGCHDNISLIKYLKERARLLSQINSDWLKQMTVMKQVIDCGDAEMEQLRADKNVLQEEVNRLKNILGAQETNAH